MSGLKNKLIQAKGKLRRMIMTTIFRGAVYKSMKKRDGECNRCGACCKLVFKCPAYIEENGEGYCGIYEDRPGICALYPINKTDLRELEQTMPDYKCGYTFIKENRSGPKELKYKVFKPSHTKSFKGTLILIAKMFRNKSKP